MRVLIKGLFFTFLAASMLGLTPIIAKFAYQAGISVETLLFLRFAIASILLFSYLFIRHHHIAVHQTQFLTIVILGFLYCLQTIFFFTSFKYILSSLAVVLLYLYPIFVVLLSIIIDRQKFSIGLIFPILLSIIGIMILVGLPTDSINYYGVLLAVGSALAFAWYVVIGNRLVKQLSPVVISSWVSGCTSFFLLISGLIKESISFQFHPTGWYLIIAISLLGSVFSSVAFYLGIKYLGPTKASLFSTIEPIVTTVSAYLLLNETVSPNQIIGICCILGGVSIVIIRDAKKENRTD